MSLVDFGQGKPALPPGHPFQGLVPDGEYWTASVLQTSTTVGTGLTVGSGVAFELGSGHVGAEFNNNPEGAWCVRGGSHILTNFATPP
jgi:hypothetical protein